MGRMRETGRDRRSSPRQVNHNRWRPAGDASGADASYQRPRSASCSTPQAAKKCHQSLVMHRLAADLVVGMEQRLS
jgi:hypothetical protein